MFLDSILGIPSQIIGTIGGLANNIIAIPGQLVGTVTSSIGSVANVAGNTIGTVANTAGQTVVVYWLMPNAFPIWHISYRLSPFLNSTILFSTFTQKSSIPLKSLKNHME